MSTLTITFITALAALCATILGSFVSLRDTERKIKAANVTANRLRWSDMLRDLVAELMSVSYTVAIIKRQIKGTDTLSAVAADHTLLDKLEHVAVLKNKIQLMLNPEKPDHHALSGAVESMHAHLVSLRELDVFERLQGDMEAITKQAHLILRREWVRVKHGE
jgi:hypothetical protein